MRLAGVSALLTFVILCAFAVAIGSLTVHRIRNDFNTQVNNAAERLPSVLQITATSESIKIEPALSDFASDADHAVDQGPHGRRDRGRTGAAQRPSFGVPVLDSPVNINGYRVVSRPAVVFENGAPRGRVFIQYGQRLADTEATVKRVELVLLIGVLMGTVLRAARGNGDRAPGDETDRPADLHGGGDRAHARPLARRAPVRGRRRGLGAGADARGDACASSTRRAGRPRRC